MCWMPSKNGRKVRYEQECTPVRVVLPKGSRTTRTSTGRYSYWYEPPYHPVVSMNPQKRKGDQAERELATLLADHLGITIRRKLGAGRQDDTGDLAGIPNTIAQVANWTDALRAIREKPVAADRQRGNAAATYAVTFIRLRGGLWRAVLTIDQWATYARETLETHD